MPHDLGSSGRQRRLHSFHRAAEHDDRTSRPKAARLVRILLL